MDIPNQRVQLQGFGLQANGNKGKLLELELRTLKNEECYEEWTNPGYQNVFNQNAVRIRPNLYEGITEQILCTKIICEAVDLCKEEKEKADCLDEYAKCVRKFGKNF